VARVVVVGGGVLGAMHALQALDRGHEVVQLEREPVARGASVRNFGLIWVSGRRPGAELELALRARVLWGELAERIPDLGFRANGSLTIVQHESEVRVLEQVVARGDAAQRELSLLDEADVRSVNPAVKGLVAAGLLCRADAAVEPRQVPAALRTAMERDPRYRFLGRCHAVEALDGGARDQRGVAYEGDIAIVCPGASHAGFSGWDGADAPLRRVRLQMMETAPLGAQLTTSIADGDSLRYYPAFDVPALTALPAPAPIVAEHHMQLLLQQRLDGRLTVGDTHSYEEPFDVAVDEAPYRHLQERVESILGVPLPPVERRWAGVYSQALDDRLYHRAQIAPRTWVVTGAGGRGMTLAPAIAEETLLSVGASDPTRQPSGR
jgi:FAD dependent oxidoreductase TIGR03364